MTVKITEVIGRSTQGVTRPFLCRGDDGRQYYVKGHGAGRHALISEWIAGNLGLRFGLPIPPFVLASIPVDLVQFSARDDIRDLGAGIAFGSKMIPSVDELQYLFIEQVDPLLRAKILLFDWWVCNGDRTLTEDGGNVNLLWSHRDSKLHVIDHNLAFDDDRVEDIWIHHVFRDSIKEWTPGFQNDMSKVMKAAINDVAGWWKAMPEEWTEVESGITLARLEKMLSRFEKSSRTFWRAQ